MASLAKWLSVRLQTKWLWVQVPLQSLYSGKDVNSHVLKYSIESDQPIVTFDDFMF